MYTGIEQLNTLVEEGGSQVSHCWSESLQTRKGEEARLIHMVKE